LTLWAAVSQETAALFLPKERLPLKKQFVPVQAWMMESGRHFFRVFATGLSFFFF
jgi:hypothetical protein